MSARQVGAGEVGLSLGGGERGLGRARIEREEELALAHGLAVAEMHALQVAADAGAHLDALRRLEAAGEIVPVDDGFLERDGHRNRWSGRRLTGVGSISASGHAKSGRCEDRSHKEYTHALSPRLATPA